MQTMQKVSDSGLGNSPERLPRGVYTKEFREEAVKLIMK